MSKRVFLIFIIAGLTGLGIVNAQWKLDKSPVKENLNDISVPSEGTGWVVGDNGTILYSVNGDWKEYQKVTTENLSSVSMIDEMEGWIVGYNGTILHFSDGKWLPVVSPTLRNLTSVTFKDSHNGIAVGELGTIIIYSNGVWKSADFSIKGDLTSASFEDNEIWLGGGLECINFPIMKMKIQSEGNEIKEYDSQASINSIFFIESDNGWAVGSPGTLIHFNGLVWEKPLINFSFPTQNSIYFSNQNNGISVGPEGSILIFANGKWIKENSESKINLKSAAIINKLYFAVGDSGTILTKRSDSDNLLQDGEFSGELLEVFPNPSDDILHVILQENVVITNSLISITDSNGKTVKQILIGTRPENSELEIATGELQNGIYFLNVSFNGKVITKKIVILH